MRRSFEDALEEVEQRAQARDELRPIAFANTSFALPAAGDTGLAGGAHSLWESAAAWAPEADPHLVRPIEPPPKPSAKPEIIARELDLARLQTPDALAQARRRFMWSNHPDRRRDFDRELANRRVAIANMLLDRALAAMVRRRRRQ